MSAEKRLLPGKGSGEAEGSHTLKDLLGNEKQIAGEHYNGAWDLPENVLFYSG